MDAKTLGKEIRRARRSKDLTQADLAKEIGCTESAISQWENGINAPRLEVYFQLQTILGIGKEEER